MPLLKQNFRKMFHPDTNRTVIVTELIILRNLWEVYVIEPEYGDEPEDKDLVFTLTIGNFTEFGYQSESEMKGHILERTKDLHSVAPAPDWKWVGVS